MTYADFLTANTTEYRGYKIRFGDVYSQSGEPILIGCMPLDPTAEEKAEIIQARKEWIDQKLDGVLA